MASLPVTVPAEDEKTGLLRPIARDEWRKFANWALIWLILANVVFASMWFIGAPPRRPEIIAAGALGLIVRNAPVWVRIVAFIAAMAYSVLGFIAGLFNLAITSMLHSLRFFLEINPSQSLEYIVGGCFLVGVCGIAIWRMRKPQGFSEIRLVLLAIGITLALAKFDGLMGHGMRGHYKRAADVETPFVSASHLSGFDAATVAPKRHRMLIMVESLGAPVGNEDMERLLFARFHSPAVTNRYELSTGETTYYNSTTAGEIRELCGRWGDYYDVMERVDKGCLPAKLAEAGYETRAYHSFTGAFFDRAKWYPNIGFQKSSFAEQLFERGARECGGVFPGACDRDVPALLAKDIKAAQKPQFIYWLTVNSHLPVPPGMNLDVDRCERISPSLAENYPMICRQFALWDQMDSAIIKGITAGDFPETDILIVGDHMPPYFDRHHRSQFAPDRVPWLLLKWKGESPKTPDTTEIVKTGDRDDGVAG